MVSAPSGNACSLWRWQPGSLDSSRTRVVVHHYRSRHPTFNWEWLLTGFAELCMVGEPQEAANRFAEQRKLGSTEGLVKRFLLDVGLLVMAE